MKDDNVTIKPFPLESHIGELDEVIRKGIGEDENLI